MDRDFDVLVVGAGPTGLTATLDLVRLGLSVHLIDAKAGPSRLSKALVLHARTLEVLETLGVAEAVEAQSLPFVALNASPLPSLPRIRIDLAAASWGDARFPGWRSLPQERTEALLIDALGQRGGAVAWSTRLVDVSTGPQGVEARLETPAGPREVSARWLLACDGGRGSTRGMLGIPRRLTELRAHFLLADVRVETKLPQDEGRVIAAGPGIVLIVPMPRTDCFRLILDVPADTGEPQDPEWYEALIRRRTRLDFTVKEVRWVSLFSLRSGTAEHLRRGPAFLLGDAAHLQSPVGGQGLNLGIQDAHNLAWKLAHVKRGWADPKILDSYEEERLPVATSVVRATALATRVLTLRWLPLRLMRGLVASLVLRLPWMKRRFGPVLGMAARPYAPGSAVSRDRPVRAIRCGTRLPDLPLPGGGTLHEQLHSERRTLLAARRGIETEDHWVELTPATLSALGLPPGIEVVVRPDRVVQSIRAG